MSELTEEEFYEEINKEFIEDQKRSELIEASLREQFKIMLKDLIDVDSLFEYLNDGHYWTPMGIVDIELTDQKRSGYSSYQHAKIVDSEDKLLYMKTETDGDIPNIEYYYVWQQTGYMEDDYSGWMLFPLNNGKFFKVSYSC